MLILHGLREIMSLIMYDYNSMQVQDRSNDELGMDREVMWSVQL